MSHRAPRVGLIWSCILVASAGAAWGLRRLGLPLYAAIPLGIVGGYVLVMAWNAMFAREDGCVREGPRDPSDPRR